MTTKQAKMTPKQEAAFRVHRMGIMKALESTRRFLGMAIQHGEKGDEARKMEAPILRELIEMARLYPASALSGSETAEILMAERVRDIEQAEERDRQIKAALTPSLTGRRVAR